MADMSAAIQTIWRHLAGGGESFGAALVTTLALLTVLLLFPAVGPLRSPILHFDALRSATMLIAIVVTLGGLWTLKAADGPAGAVAVAAAGGLLPLWAAWTTLPAQARLGALAAFPLAVVGVGDVVGRWDGHAPARRLAPRAGLLAGTAIAVHLLAYNPFADPGCLLTCARGAGPLAHWLPARFAVATSGTLTAGAAAVYAVAAWRRRQVLPRAVLVGAYAALSLLAGTAALRAAAWGDVALNRIVPLVEVLAVGAIGAVTCVTAARVLRRRVLVDRLAQRLVGADAFSPRGDVLGIQFALPDDGTWVDQHGRPVEDWSGHGVVLHDGTGPVLRLALRRGADEFDVLARLGPAIQLGLKNAQLSAVAQARLVEVQASQRRVVAAIDGERRRIERDLHDGVQQRLVGASFHLRAGRAGADPAAIRVLDAAERDLGKALVTLRRLSRGMFPAVLGDEGLHAALEELVAESGVRSTLELAVGDVRDKEAERAAYATIAAALDCLASTAEDGCAHVAVTQQARLLGIRASLDFGASSISVAEFADVRDRVGALAGTLIVEPTPRGAIVTAEIPCAS